MDRRLVGAAGTLGLVAATQVLAVYLADPFVAAGLTIQPPDVSLLPGGPPGAGAGGGAGGTGSGGGAATATPSSRPDAGGDAGLWGLVPVVLGLGLGTGLLLAIRRFGLDPRVVRVVLFSSLAMAMGFVVHAVAPLGVGAALLLAGGLALVGWHHPEWYVVDSLVVVGVAGVTALLGASIGPGTAVVALVGTAAYDAYAVYGSGHMTRVADESADLGAPTTFVVPTERGTSTRDGLDLRGAAERAAEGGGEASDAPGEPSGHGVAVLGAGDALFPGVLVVAASDVAGPVVGPFTLPALGALAGTLVGLVALQVFVARRPGIHAGLPPLNGLAIAGYLAGALGAGLSLGSAVGLA